MISKSNVKSVSCDDVRIFRYLFQNNVLENIIGFFCDSRNNQGLGKCHPASAFGSADNTDNAASIVSIITDITKNASNNCLLFK